MLNLQNLKDKFLKYKKFVLAGLFLCLILTLTIFAFAFKKEKDEKSSSKINFSSSETNLTNEKNLKSENKSEQDFSENEVEKIFIDIEGAVHRPGVVSVPKGIILNEAFAFALGIKEQEADMNFISKNINRASIVLPNSYIYIPYKTEISKNDQSAINAVSNSSYSSKTKTYSVSTTSSQNSENTKTSEQTTYSGPVNINTASLEILDTLEGIGPTYAQRIIDYRNTNGSFSTPHDIVNVRGIGESIYEKNKNRIVV